MTDKKKLQLGMNPSTAQGRLLKDILFKFVQAHHPTCYKCGQALTRETFSIEHKIPWLDSDDPVGLFFDLDNIAFSHLTCNIADRRSTRPLLHGTDTMYGKHGCRCNECKTAKAQIQAASYSTDARRERYKRTGH